MAKKKKLPNRVTFAKGALRRASLMWAPINQCRTNARRERGKYECAMCHELFGPKEVQIDHIESVIDINKGWESWDVYIERLFCDIENLACLCKQCHSSKTSAEVHMRKFSRAKRKAEASVHDEGEDEEI